LVWYYSFQVKQMRDLPLRTKILLGICIVVVLYAVYEAFLKPTERIEMAGFTTDSSQLTGQSPESVLDQNRASISAEPAPEAQDREEEVLEWQDEDLTQFWGPRDPFYRDVTNRITTEQQESTPVDNLRYEGIIWSKGEARVLINSEILKKGDYIDGIQIVDVQEDFIVVVANGEEYILRLGGE